MKKKFLKEMKKTLTFPSSLSDLLSNRRNGKMDCLAKEKLRCPLFSVSEGQNLKLRI